MSGSPQYDLTANFGLKKPWPTMDADAWGDHTNLNWDQIDALLASLTVGAQWVLIATPAIAAGSLSLDLSKGGVFRVTLNADINLLSLASVLVGNKVTTCQLELLGDGTQRAVNFGNWTVATGTPVPTSTIGRKDVYDIRTDGAHVLVWLIAQNVPA
jgi:hypothetical protein